MIRWPARRHWPLLAGLFVLVPVLLLAEAWRGGALWRSAYPHLPRQVQAIPYRLRARLPRSERAPQALPTPGLQRTPAASQTFATAPPPAAPPTTAALGAAPIASSESTGEAVQSATPGNDPAIPASATAIGQGLPSKVLLQSPRQQYQTWNNCGPATISMLLGFFGTDLDQRAAAVFLKPDPDDKNVGPEELAAWARSQGFEAAVYRAGSIDEARSLLAAGLPLLVETWFIPDPGDEMGHYRLLLGYEDGETQGSMADSAASADSGSAPASAAVLLARSGHFIAADSYQGPRVLLPYASFDADWRVFGRLFVLVRPLESAPLAGSLGTGLPALGDKAERAARAFEQASAEVAGRGDAFAWFNLGQSLLDLGDPAGAAEAFDRARAIGLPWRMLWYQFGPFEAYAATGRWEDVQSLAEANLANAANLEESHYWLGRAHQAAGRRDAALAAFRRAAALNPGFAPAVEALSGLDSS